MADLKTPEGSQEKGDTLPDDIMIGHTGEIINASGHRDQLDRQYGILSICGMALTVDNAWVAIGTSLNVAICEFGRAWETQFGADCSLDRQWRTSRCSV
jgi:choline transport protein